jgi:hypothetical protein
VSAECKYRRTLLRRQSKGSVYREELASLSNFVASCVESRLPPVENASRFSAPQREPFFLA